MKTIFRIYFVTFLFIFIHIYPLFGNRISDESDQEIKQPELIDDDVDLYQAGDIYLGGQPEKETLDTLAVLGVRLVINIRTDQEIETHSRIAFDEKEYVKEIGLDYVHIPAGGPSGYSPEIITGIENALKNNPGKVLIHCRGAGRATLVWMAWLVRFRDYSINEAAKLGKMVKFTFLLEELLGYPISMQKDE
jgi:uncharacterized protein (TIGR01244 family)